MSALIDFFACFEILKITFVWSNSTPKIQETQTPKSLHLHFHNLLLKNNNKNERNTKFISSKKISDKFIQFIDSNGKETVARSVAQEYGDDLEKCFS